MSGVALGLFADTAGTFGLSASVLEGSAEPNKADLKARAAKTGAGVSGCSASVVSIRLDGQRWSARFVIHGLIAPPSAGLGTGAFTPRFNIHPSMVAAERRSTSKSALGVSNHGGLAYDLAMAS